MADLLRTSRGPGLRPVSQAPDFDLESNEGGRFRLADTQGRPALLHFGSEN
jgi:peroxiredoxin